jgi:hypothetical protein
VELHLEERAVRGGADRARRLMPTRALALLTVAAGAAIEISSHGASATTVADWATGAVLIVGGELAWERRRRPLLALAGIAWFAGTAAAPLLYLHRGPLAQLTLSHPETRPRTWLARAVVAAAWVDGAIEPLARNGAVTLVLAGLIALTAVHDETRSTGAALAFAAVLALGAWNAKELVLWTYDCTVAAIASRRPAPAGLSPRSSTTARRSACWCTTRPC